MLARWRAARGVRTGVDACPHECGPPRCRVGETSTGRSRAETRRVARRRGPGERGEPCTRSRDRERSNQRFIKRLISRVDMPRVVPRAHHGAHFPTSPRRRGGPGRPDSPQP